LPVPELEHLFMQNDLYETAAAKQSNWANRAEDGICDWLKA
jgi:hypothetical protein